MQRSLNYLKAVKLGKLEGALVCFVSIMGLTFLLGWIPVIGFLAALFLGGLIGGLVAKSLEDGIIAGFMGGLLGSIIASILLVVFLSAVFYRHFLGGLVGGTVGILLILISIPFALISCIGGAVGGAINQEAPSRRYVPPAPLPAPPMASQTQDFCPQCGTRVQPGATYCGNCGEKLR